MFCLQTCLWYKLPVFMTSESQTPRTWPPKTWSPKIPSLILKRGSSETWTFSLRESRAHSVAADTIYYIIKHLPAVFSQGSDFITHQLQLVFVYVCFFHFFLLFFCALCCVTAVNVAQLLFTRKVLQLLLLTPPPFCPFAASHRTKNQ